MRESASRMIAVAAIALATAQAACAQMPPSGASAAHGTPAAQTAPGADGESAAQRCWYDGPRKRTVRIDPDWVADFRGAKPSLAPAPASPTGTKSASLAPGPSEVLRDETGEPRALPGGVIVRLHESDVGNAAARFAGLGLTPLRALDPERRTWLVESPPGLESLALANRLHETGQFESATPNWWRPRALK